MQQQKLFSSLNQDPKSRTADFNFAEIFKYSNNRQQRFVNIRILNSKNEKPLFLATESFMEVRWQRPQKVYSDLRHVPGVEHNLLYGAIAIRLVR